MKIALLLLGVVWSVGCQHSERHAGSRKPVSAFATSDTGEPARETKLRSLQDITEARARTYQKQGYSAAEARAIAEAEYFRAGKK